MKKKVAWKLSAAGNLRLSLPHFIALFPPEMDGSRSLKVAIFFLDGYQHLMRTIKYRNKIS